MNFRPEINFIVLKQRTMAVVLVFGRSKSSYLHSRNPGVNV